MNALGRAGAPRLPQPEAQSAAAALPALPPQSTYKGAGAMCSVCGDLLSPLSSLSLCAWPGACGRPIAEWQHDPDAAAAAAAGAAPGCQPWLTAGMRPAHCLQPTCSRLSPCRVGLAHSRLASSLQQMKREAAGSRWQQGSMGLSLDIAGMLTRSGLCAVARVAAHTVAAAELTAPPGQEAPAQRAGTRVAAPAQPAAAGQQQEQQQGQQRQGSSRSGAVAQPAAAGQQQGQQGQGSRGRAAAGAGPRRAPGAQRSPADEGILNPKP